MLSAVGQVDGDDRSGEVVGTGVGGRVIFLVVVLSQVA